MTSAREMKQAVYAFLGFAAAFALILFVTMYVQAAKSGVGSGFGDTVIVNTKPHFDTSNARRYFDEHKIPQRPKD